MPLGLYVSVPFCRTKCSYCNFASDVFSRAAFEHYVNRLCAEIADARLASERAQGTFDAEADSIYFGGGTPSILDSHQLRRLFVTIRQNFCLREDAEITVECAPGTLAPAQMEALVEAGVNRVSLGVQSFVDAESAAVGRLHKRVTVVEDIARLRAAGITNINLDLIAGLPHQTAESWDFSLAEAIAAGAPHVSIYMLEVDEDSRLGRELLAGGTRYHAHFVPDENLTADLYIAACERLNAAGIVQYEISNFARTGFESRHNLKYWTRKPYLGFGVDAHSMLYSSADPYRLGKAESSRQSGGSPPCELVAADLDAVRFANADSLEPYLSGAGFSPTVVTRRMALEETFFLGLRLIRGVDLRQIAAEHGPAALTQFSGEIEELVELGLLQRDQHILRLTRRGILLSNEVFARFISDASVVV